MAVIGTFRGLDDNGRLPSTAKTDLAADFADRSSPLRGALPDPLDWRTSRAFDVAQPPRVEDRPTVKYDPGMGTKLTSPAEYKPKIVGTGAQVTGWNGQDDPNFAFFPGEFYTRNGATADLAMEGAMKPGGGAQAAGWPVVVSFTTASPVVELAYYGTAQGMSQMIEVNGRLVDDVIFSATGSYLGSSGTLTLTFPDTGRTRTVRVWSGHSPGLAAVRLPTGKTLAKPTTAGRLAAVVGDSFVNGSGSSTGYPNQGALNTETFAPRLLRTLGYDRLMLAGIGGSGWLTSNPYSQRLPIILGNNPDLLVFFGSVNDGSNPAGLKDAVASTLAQAAQVPNVVVIPHGVAGYDGAIQQVREATQEAGRTFVEWGQFFTGSGRVGAPKGDGNRDFYIMPDGTHPTLDGHRAMARALFEHLA